MTGAIQKATDIAADDFRRTIPRFQGEAFDRNLQLATHLKNLAQRKDCSPAQLALAWVLAQGEDIVPIPDTKRLRYLEDNLGALDVALTPDELAQIDSLFPPRIAQGDRYAEAGMALLNP